MTAADGTRLCARGKPSDGSPRPVLVGTGPYRRAAAPVFESERAVRAIGFDAHSAVVTKPSF